MQQLEIMFPVEILLADDNPGDARLAVEASKAARSATESPW
jgi:hypothetical protein